MINLWAMERTNRERFIRFCLICLVILFFLPLLHISYIYAGKSEGISSEAEAYREKGYNAQQRGDIDTAIEWYQKAANLMPNYASPHNDLGILFETKGWLDRAESEYEKALTIDPTYKEVYTNLALLYERKGELEKAAFYWMRRYELGSPEDPWTQEAKKRLEKLGLVDKIAAKTMHKSEKQKTEPVVKKSSDWTRLGVKKNEKPAEAFKKDKDLNEELQESLRLAEERLRKEKSGKISVAAAPLKKQVETDTVNSSEISTSYGKAKDYYDKGEYTKALDAIRIAKQSSPYNKQLLELEDTIKFKMKEERIDDHYKEGMIRYRQKDFAGARKEFEAILSILPE